LGGDPKKLPLIDVPKRDAKIQSREYTREQRELKLQYKNSLNLK